MIKSSRAFDANERVAEYRKSVAAVQENVLLFKGFLGPTVKDRPELTSVGHRAARAAGVIVDSLGKLRCPPGTPNANQFTDMQMSNCLTPSAESAARGAASMAGKLIDGARVIFKSEKVKNGSKAAAMIALQTMDYMYADGSDSMTQSTLFGMVLLKSGGAQLLDFATDSLHRRGKISDKKKEQLEAVAGKIKRDATVDAKNFLLATLKRRKDKKEDPKADPPVVKSPSGFKKGNSTIAKAKDFDPVIGIADANGRNISRDLPTVKKDIDTVEKASQHIANGGKLNEISDALVLDAILENIDVYDSEGNVSEIKRFELLGTGGGVVGMNRFRDRSTGQMFGVKYASRQSMWDENVPHSKAPLTKGGASRWFEPVNEVLAVSITEEFGYPSSSLRVVQAAPTRAAMGVVTDLVHNSYEGKILSSDPEVMKKVDSRKLVHMHVMDIVLANGDRHSGNILFAENSDGVDAIPIDHSFVMSVYEFSDTAEKFSSGIRNHPVGNELTLRHGRSAESHGELVGEAEKVLQDIQKIDADSLEDRLLSQLDEMVKDRNLIGEFAMNPEQLEQLETLQSDIRKSASRLREMQGMTPKQLADIIVVPPAPKADSALEDLVASVV
jgi:hypothetical protein